MNRRSFLKKSIFAGIALLLNPAKLLRLETNPWAHVPPFKNEYYKAVHFDLPIIYAPYIPLTVVSIWGRKGVDNVR